jgi:outer membrane lipoprotein-sorting protein
MTSPAPWAAGLLLTAACVALAEPSPQAAQLPAQSDKIISYACTMQSFNRLGAESSTKTVRFTWARGGRVRMEVVEGPDKGSVLTRDGQGQLRGRKGGFLKMIAVTLKEDDRRVVNLRGRKFYEADWGSVIQEIRAREQAGWAVQPLADDAVKGAACRVVELVAPAGSSGVTRDRVWISRDRDLILRRQQFEGETLVNDVTWWDVELNPAVEDALFTL